MKKTAIIMVTYNGWEMTKACLMDLPKDDNFIIAVADNCSSDNTVENIRKEFPYVHVYPQTDNRGFGAANNAAIKGLIQEGIEFENICLLNNDTRFASKDFKGLVDSLDSVEKWGNYVVTPTIFNKDGSLQPHYFTRLSHLQFFLNAFRNESAAAKYIEGSPRVFAHDKSFEETYWASAVCWTLSRKLYDEITKAGEDFFDENIFMYYEDYDLAQRALALGYHFLINKKVGITHLGGGSAKGTLSRALQHDHSQEYVFKKHLGLKGIFLSKAFRSTRSLLRILSALSLVLIRKKDPSYLKLHFILLKESIL